MRKGRRHRRCHDGDHLDVRVQVAPERRPVVHRIPGTMLTCIYAISAANAEVMINLDRVPDGLVAELDRTGGDAGMAVDASLGMDTDNRG